MSGAQDGPLSIPELDDDADTLEAAFAYARAGWYVGPCDQKTKHPGSVLGKGWPLKTSQDPKELSAWWAGSDLGIFLHVGRSGAVVLDVDDHAKLPDQLAGIIAEHQPPFQSTRTTDPRRGHYVFAQPDDRLLGSAWPKGLAKGWGEVRGKNGVIVVQPTQHEKPEGRYQWVRTGAVPASPELAALLPDATDSEDPATDSAVRTFLEAHTTSAEPGALTPILNSFSETVAEGGSRHEALKLAAIWACREAAIGLFPARVAMERLWALFSAAMKADLPPGRYPRSEFRALWAWAVAQAMGTDLEARRAEVAERLAKVEAERTKPLEPVTDPAAEETPPLRDPADYFRDKGAGVDVALLAEDAMAMGPLRVGRDGLFWAYEHGVWHEQRDEVRGRVVDLLRGRYRGSHAANVEHVVRRKVGTIGADPVPDFINFRGSTVAGDVYPPDHHLAGQPRGGGMLDWRTGQMHAWAPDYLSTVQLPIAWDPEAACVRFDGFLASVLSEDYITLVWEMLGYLMMSGNPLQQAFLFYGTGQNGKGTLLRVIKALLGERNISAVSLDSLNTNRFAAASLYGKTANLAGDIDATYQESTAAFKSLTGEDVYRTEHKHRDAFEFTSWAVPVFSANEVPGSADVSEGYLRRWTVVHFARHIEESEKVDGLSDLLVQELPGIAAKALPALRTLMQRRHFDKTRGEVADGAEEFARKIDQVRQWVEQCCLTGPEMATQQTLLPDAYASYRAWVERTGSGKLSAEKFYARLAGIPGLRVKKVRGVRYVQGLRIMEPGHQGMFGTPASGEASPFDGAEPVD